MSFNFDFHSDAEVEYAEAIEYYLREASGEVADGFVDEVESAILSVVAAPARWRVVEEPEVRRFTLKHFPFVIFYQLDEVQEHVLFIAVMHCSREPGYWRYRLN